MEQPQTLPPMVVTICTSRTGIGIVVAEKMLDMEAKPCMKIRTMEWHPLDSNRPEEIGASFDRIFGAISATQVGGDVAVIDTKSSLHSYVGHYLCNQGFTVFEIKNPKDYCHTQVELIWTDFPDFAARNKLANIKGEKVGKTRLMQEVMTAMNLAYNYFMGTLPEVYMQKVKEVA